MNQCLLILSRNITVTFPTGGECDSFKLKLKKKTDFGEKNKLNLGKKNKPDFGGEIKLNLGKNKTDFMRP